MSTVWQEERQLVVGVCVRVSNQNLIHEVCSCQQQWSLGEGLCSINGELGLYLGIYSKGD